MRYVRYLILVVLLTPILGSGRVGAQHNIEIDEKANPWTHLSFNNDPEDFQFAIVSDRTGRSRKGVFASAVRKINLLQPEFVICVGDLIQGDTDDSEEIEKQWEEFDRIVNKLQMPFFYLPGNHDISNPVMLEVWRQRRGRPYYHFVYHDVLFLCLDSEGGYNEHKESHVNEEQLEYFHKVLQENGGARWTLVFVHRPMWEKYEKSWLEFEKMLTDRNYTVFAGHLHQYAKSIRRGQSYLRLATTGAAYDIGKVSIAREESIRLGRFDHIVWVTMTQKGPKIANLMLDGIFDENVTSIFIANAAKNIKKAIDKGQAIECQPIKVRGDFFTSGKTKIKITNRAFIPMKVKGKFKDHPHLKVVPPGIDEYLLPWAGKTIDVEVKADEPIRVELLSALVLDATIIYKVPTLSPVTCKVTSSIVIKADE